MMICFPMLSLCWLASVAAWGVGWPSAINRAAKNNDRSCHTSQNNNASIRNHGLGFGKSQHYFTSTLERDCRNMNWRLQVSVSWLTSDFFKKKRPFQRADLIPRIRMSPHEHKKQGACPWKS